MLQFVIPNVIKHRLYDRFAEQTKKRILQEELALFRIIFIETRTLCNGACTFCPAAAQYKSRPDRYMPKWIYTNVVNQLQQLDYKGRISFYCNNEPLIDERIYDFLEEAREKCPRSYLEIKTNGKVLDIGKLQLLISLGLNEIVITDYKNVRDFSPNIKEIVRAVSEGGLELGKCKISVFWRKCDEILENRAGTSPNKVDTKVPIKRFCYRPFEMITIGAKGQIGFCCADFDFRHTWGNVSNISLKEAWHSNEHRKIRENLLNGDRACMDLCRKCDFIGYSSDDLMGFYRLVRWA